MKNKAKYALIIIALLLEIFIGKVQASTAKVATETLNLRSEASTNSSIVELLNADDELEIISEQNGWLKVKHGSKQGYVNKEYVKVTGENDAVTSKPATTPTPTPATTPTPSNDKGNTTTTNFENNSTMKLKNDVKIKILPLINSNDLGTAKSGEDITVVAVANNWMFVETDEIAGWIIKDAIVEKSVSQIDTEKNQDDEKAEESKDDKEDYTDKEENTSKETKYDNETTKYVSASSVYVRSEASTDSKIVTTLIKNTDVKIVGESGEWYKVRYNDFNGYIRKDFLSDKKTEETNRSSANRNSVANVSNNTASDRGVQIVNYAKQYLNCPYSYGAAGSKSFDCSGFTMYVYKNFGYSLSHSATAQSRVGQRVAKENLQPGDLVFFLDYETMDGIGHCGIYIGDGNFIHASSGSGYCVKISTLLSGSYYNRYATARRII